MEAYEQALSEGMQAKMRLDSLGNLNVDVKRPPQEKEIVVKDSLIYVPVDRLVVTNKLTKTQNIWITTGKISFFIILIIILYIAIKHHLKSI